MNKLNLTNVALGIGVLNSFLLIGVLYNQRKNDDHLDSNIAGILENQSFMVEDLGLVAGSSAVLRLLIYQMVKKGTLPLFYKDESGDIVKDLEKKNAGNNKLNYQNTKRKTNFLFKSKKK